MRKINFPTTQCDMKKGKENMQNHFFVTAYENKLNFPTFEIVLFWAKIPFKEFDRVNIDDV